MKNTCAVLSLFLVLLSFSANALEIRIVEVHDGDTLNAVNTATGEKLKVRLMGVDTPETDFFGKSQGEAAELAKAALTSYLPKGTLATLSDDSDFDKHGRVLGRIIKDGVDINKTMLEEGWGFFYFIAPFEKRTLMDYSEAAKAGVENQKGLFQENKTEEPYLFRLRVRKQTGRNLLGDLETKRLVPTEEIKSIPLWRRVYFPDNYSAEALGYR